VNKSPIYSTTRQPVSMSSHLVWSPAGHSISEQVTSIQHNKATRLDVIPSGLITCWSSKQCLRRCFHVYLCQRCVMATYRSAVIPVTMSSHLVVYVSSCNHHKYDAQQGNPSRCHLIWFDSMFMSDCLLVIANVQISQVVCGLSVDGQLNWWTGENSMWSHLLDIASCQDQLLPKSCL
jgi:hypothetical protein